MFSAEYGIENYADNGKVFLKKADEGDTFFISEKKVLTVHRSVVSPVFLGYFYRGSSRVLI